MITFAASVKSARERVWGSWIPENSDGERNSLDFCAAAVSLPKTTSNDAQLAPTSEIVAERILRRSQLSLFTLPVGRMAVLLAIVSPAFFNRRSRSTRKQAKRSFSPR